MISSTSKEFTFNSENSASFYLFERTFHYGESYVRSFYLFFRIHGALVLNQHREPHNALIMRTSPGFPDPELQVDRAGERVLGLRSGATQAPSRPGRAGCKVREAGLQRGKPAPAKT